MPTITLITFSDNSTFAFSTDGATITKTDSNGTATVFTTTAPVVAPEDVEVDIKDSNGNVRTFVPKA
jgi:hypothetical protein